ncbi:MAG: hypothetical protein F6J89_14050 [Symploca sp. SIO1C4]|uniref:Uncharacterized protein n=1 Tax=Symploca sp. SIO1C4 TaxID=2607765 RepID=A0A6B3NHD1_9CYAN|nr:hypothetical protein [Symploca sp. SIO1C4]
MLYLAEVQKPKTGFLGGGGKAELKLLACQRTEQSWTVERTEEVVPAEEANAFNDGALVIVNLVNRLVKGEIEPAGDRVATILQNFSRLLEKSKNQEEEIEQWKQSLTFQSQEMNRREIELEQRLDQMQAREEELALIEQQRQELESASEETTRLQEEFERKSHELEGAWEHLRGEQRRLEEIKAEGQYNAGLDAEQAGVIQELLNRLSEAVAPTSNVREQLHLGLEVINSEQSVLDEQWQQLEQQQAEAAHLQAEVERQGQEVNNCSQHLQDSQVSLEQAKTELKLQQQTLELKREALAMLSLQLQSQQSLQRELALVATNSTDVGISQKVDIESLEQMPLGELSEAVDHLQQDLAKVVDFVNAQEEELTLQRQNLEQLQSKLDSASEYDRISLETELADERDCYRMLDETLVGQRRNLREREEILSQHRRVLQRRQGVIDVNYADSQTIDLEPILTQLEAQTQQRQEELQKLEGELEQINQSINSLEELVAQKTGEQEVKLTELRNLQQEWNSTKESAAQLLSKVNLYQEMLQLRQDSITEIRQKLEAIADGLNHIQEIGDYQLQLLAQMQQTISSLLQSPELAAS